MNYKATQFSSAIHYKKVFFQQLSAKYPPIVVLEPAESFRAIQIIISDSVTKDFLIKKQETPITRSF